MRGLWYTFWNSEILTNFSRYFCNTIKHFVDESGVLYLSELRKGFYGRHGGGWSSCGRWEKRINWCIEISIQYIPFDWDVLKFRIGGTTKPACKYVPHSFIYSTNSYLASLHVLFQASEKQQKTFFKVSHNACTEFWEKEKRTPCSLSE